MEKQIEDLIREAMEVIGKLIRSGTPIFCGFSGGKDSGILAHLVLAAAKAAAADGLKPMVVVSTSNTLVENPEIAMHFRTELRKMREYGMANGFRVITKVVTPLLSSTWQVKVLSGRGLPSFQGTNADCSVDMKVRPQQSFRRKLFKDLASSSLSEPVICIGTRFDESSRRAANMAERGESATTPVRNKDGELVLSPIAYWTTDDVWEAIGLASNGMLESYTDFAETKRIYAHAESTSCAVVADAIGTGRKRGGCGQRTGCHVCQMAEDKSLENMVAYDDRYAYARGLVKFNKFLRATRYDWNRRHALGRTIKGGYVCVQPDTYHPSMQRELFRYMLQLDYDEVQRAEREGESPMFQLLPTRMIVAIDAIWSLNGFARPFAAWADYRDIWQRGIRYDIPEVEPVPETPMPIGRYLHVGNEWDEVHNAMSTGMRDVYAESLTETSACGMKLRETADGRVIWDLETERSFDVDVESAEMLLDFELDAMLKKYDAGFPPGGVTSAYKFYLAYGALKLSHSQLLEHDQILRRTAFKDSLGLSYEYDLQALMGQTISFAELPEDAQEAWAHKDEGKKKAAKVLKLKQVGEKAEPEVAAEPDTDQGWCQTDLFDLMAA